MSGPFLILHGLEGSGPDHWQTWLAGRLRAAGRTVAYPDLPDPFQPRREAWLTALRDELERLGPGVTVLCHSLACLLWLHHASGSGGAWADRVLLVAPNCEVPDLPEVADFFPVPLDRDAVARAAGATRVVCSDEDPYCPAGAVPSYAEPLGLPVDVVRGGGHLNPEGGFGPWPAVEAWCYGAKNGVET